jgi:hypothetical protein
MSTTGVRLFSGLAAVCCLVLVIAVSLPAAAQPAGEPGAGGAFGGRRGHQGPDAAKAGPGMPVITPAPDPRQRLDAGALLCDSLEALQARQAAIRARLAHQIVAEPTAHCRILAAMTPVAVLEREGPASTEVRLPGPPARTGWTDARIPELPVATEAAAARPR